LHYTALQVKLCCSQSSRHWISYFPHYVSANPIYYYKILQGIWTSHPRAKYCIHRTRK